MDNIQLDSILLYLNEGIINETFKDMRDGGPYGKSFGELKRMIKNLLKKRVKKDEDSKKSSINKNPQIIPEEKSQAEKDEKELVNNLNKVISKMKSNSDFKKKVKEKSEEYLNDLKDDFIDDDMSDDLDDDDREYLKQYNKLSKQDIEDSKLPPFKCNVFEDLYCEFEQNNTLYFYGIYEILGGDQMQRIVHSWVLYEVVDNLKNQFPDTYSKFNFDYGDGDEGCLYVCYKLKRDK